MTEGTSREELMSVIAVTIFSIGFAWQYGA